MKALKGLIAALAIAGAALLTTSAQAQVYSFDAISLGTFQAEGALPTVSVDITHPAVTASAPFTFSSLTAHQIVNFLPLPPAVENGTFTFTAVGGATLTGTYSGVLLPTANPLVYTVPGTFAFSGGTGQFAGATGGGQLNALILFENGDLESGISTIHWTGELALVPEPTALALGGLGLAMLMARRWRKS